MPLKCTHVLCRSPPPSPHLQTDHSWYSTSQVLLERAKKEGKKFPQMVLWSYFAPPQYIEGLVPAARKAYGEAKPARCLLSWPPTEIKGTNLEMKLPSSYLWIGSGEEESPADTWLMLPECILFHNENSKSWIGLGFSPLITVPNLSSCIRIPLELAKRAKKKKRLGGLPSYW